MPKRIVPLSDLAVKNAKPAAKDYTLYDGDGLMLLVKTTGGKLWRFKYRFNGHEKRMAMGAYPQVSLKDARLKREVSRKQVANGIDPAVEIKQQKEVAASKAETFAIVAREWLERQSERISETHSKRIWRSFEKDVLPKIGVTPINEITIPILVDVIRAIEDRGAGETASKVSQWTAAIFRYCLHTGRLAVNPAADMRGILKSIKCHPSRHARPS